MNADDDARAGEETVPCAGLPDDETPAWYGKLASLGDFASRRLSQDTARTLDAWLAQGVSASRARLGERWLEVYLTGPLWRFSWAPGVLDSHWWFGVLMPSVDNVGRYFPLVVLQARAAAPTAEAALQRLEDWYAAVSVTALRTLQPGGSLDQFEAELAQIADTSPLPCGALVPAWVTTHSPQRTRHELAPGTSLAACFERLAVTETLQRAQSCSLWWPLRPGAPASSVTLAVGLPTGESFVPMFEGAW